MVSWTENRCPAIYFENLTRGSGGHKVQGMDDFHQWTISGNKASRLSYQMCVEAKAPSMLAYSNEDLESDQQEGTITDFKPLTQANDLPIRFLNPKMGQAHNNRANGKNVPPIGDNLYDSDSKHPSWEPKVDFSQSFLFTNKQKQNKFLFEVILHSPHLFHSRPQSLLGAWARGPKGSGDTGLKS